MPDFDAPRPRRPAVHDHFTRNVILAVSLLAVALALVFVIFKVVSCSRDRVTGTVSPASSEAPESAILQPPVTPPPAATPAPTPQGPPAFMAEGNLNAVAFRVQGSLSSSIAAALPEDQRALATALADRLFGALQWFFESQKDVRGGDEVKIVYNPSARTERAPLYGFWYKSKRLGKTLFYFYYPEGGTGGVSYFDAEGNSIAEVMKRPPLPPEIVANAIVRPMGANAVVFNVPVGTPLLMPFPARILRLNWDQENLGRCIEARYLLVGFIAQFCNLEAISDKAAEGAMIDAGTQVATTGDSGKTSVPRLLYRTFRSAEEGDLKPVSPFEVHGKDKKQLPAAERVNFLAVRAKVEKLFEKITVPPAAAN